MPLPAQHLPTIFRVCHFSPEEQAEFLALYARAHPAQFAAIEELAEIERDVIRIPVPDLGDAETRAAVEATDPQLRRAGLRAGAALEARQGGGKP